MRKQFVAAVLVLVLLFSLPVPASRASLDYEATYESAVRMAANDLSNLDNLRDAVEMLSATGAYGFSRNYVILLNQIINIQSDLPDLQTAKAMFEMLRDASAFTEDLVSRNFPSIDDLISYVNARILEKIGNIDSACATYRHLPLLDAPDRAAALTLIIARTAPTPKPTSTPTPKPTSVPKPTPTVSLIPTTPRPPRSTPTKKIKPTPTPTPNPTPASASTSLFKTVVNRDNTVTLTEYRGDKTDLHVPASCTVNGKQYKVSGVDFYGHKNLTSVFLPEGLSFFNLNGCTSLRRVTLPTSVKTIPEFAFFDCPSMEYISIPGSVTAIERHAFHDCTGLKSVTIPRSVKTIGEYAFENCTSLASVVLEEGVEKLDAYSFYRCDHLTSIVIPATVTYIDETAFGLVYYASEKYKASWKEKFVVTVRKGSYAEYFCKRYGYNFRY